MKNIIEYILGPTSQFSKFTGWP